MSFQYPYALLVLLAIPVLILIYILRNRYKEATAPSTYLWELSQKFLKKRNPFHSRENLIALFVQMFAIAFMAVTLAHPILSLKGQAENRVFVLDGSASRNRKREGTGYDGKETKFEVAKEDILKKVYAAKKGSTFTLIVTDSEEPKTVCGGIQDVTRFEKYRDTVNCSYATNEIKDSISLAQKLVSSGSGSDVYLATDKKVTCDDNIHLRSYYNDKQTNYAITDVKYENKDDPEHGTNIVITPTYVCYDHDNARFRIRFAINGKDLGSVATVTAVSAGLEYSSGYGFKYDDPIESITCTIDEDYNEKKKGYVDCLEDDNSYTFYNEKNDRQASVLLVSNQPRFLSTAFKAWGVDCTVVSPAAFNTTSGYDIYVFDCVSPKKLPTDGAIWFISPNQDVTDTGFTYLNSYSDSKNGFTCTYTDNDNSLTYQQLTKNLAKKDVLVSYYSRYTLEDDFTTILAYKNVPMIFAGKTSYGQREVIFSFPLQSSSMPLTYDFLALTRNLVQFSHPSLLDKFSYTVGDTLAINTGDEVETRTMKRPDGTAVPIVKGTSQYLSYEFDEVGTYVLTTVNTDKTGKEVYRYVKYPKEEGNPLAEDSNAYQIVKNPDASTVNGIFDSILPVAIAAAVFFVADWFLYAREQY